ncbi:hypothetical protein [Faecalicoccus pleomorphus]|uniref:hypothetical protein n=1 Tax=Faecalicoccus pleomorphus TaxID=1323 RepID=UPI00195F8A1D|nr:hypothetical protein [Faecalicoccus pleomorphus]MBM6807526.1 hypothetical protein [Faecalicoccus pleomorphus]
MSRPKRDTKALNIKIESNLYEQLEEYSISSKLTKTAIVEFALEKYLKQQNNSSSKG